LADSVQTDSQYTLNEMTRKHGASIRRKGMVAPGWVDSEQFRPSTVRAEGRRVLGTDWDTDVPIFFTLRRLEARMGLDTLVQACVKLAAKGIEFRTLIGGGGSLRDSLQQAIDEAGLQSRIRLLGRLSEEQLPIAYAAADCFVLPTKALECFGLIALEAFATNTPVIASRVAAIPEIAARQGEAWLFEPGNADELSTKMHQFLTGDLAVADVRSIALEFDRRKVLPQWLSILLQRRSTAKIVR
jgi:glycosyltransferase involved in cell wall biosynthesis